MSQNRNIYKAGMGYVIGNYLSIERIKELQKAL